MTQKQCRKCGIEKDSSEFYKNSRYKDGLFSYCKSCMRGYVKTWESAHPESAKERGERWRVQNRELCSKLSGKWNKSHKDRKNAFNAKWNKKHPDKRRAMERNREMKERGALGNGISAEQWIELQDEYGYRCAYCGTRTKLQLDHVVAISRGRKHDIDNAVPACETCNKSKNSKSLLSFLYVRRYG